METIPQSHTTTSWWLMHLHNAAYALMGVILLLYPTQHSTLHMGLLGTLLLLAGACTLALGTRRRRLRQADNDWFILSSLRDGIFGLLLLFYLNSPVQMMVNLLGLWAIIYAFLQAIEANFYFLGTRSNDDKDYRVEVIHFICVFIAGGVAFLLIMRPDALDTSLGFVGFLLIALGLVQEVLTHRLQQANTRH